MDDSVVNIMGYILHGWQAKAAFLFSLFLIFSLGFYFGHHIATVRCNAGLDLISAKLDNIKQPK